MSRAAERRQRARVKDLVETHADTKSSDGDPRLTTFLADGPDEQFEQVRRDAIDALTQSDIVAIWLQAIGDGTPLGHARGNPIEQEPPHNALYLAGYDDDLTHPEIVQIAVQLFAHHACVFTSVPRRLTPADGSEAFEQQGREAIRNTIDLSTTAADQMYSASDSDSDSAEGIEGVSDLFESRPLAEQCERAISILEEEDLSMFWVQVMTTTELISLHVPAEGDQPTIDELTDSPVEYFQARPTNADFELAKQLAMETTGQHQYVAAQTADQPVESIAEQAVQVALESGYTMEIDSL